MAKSRGRRDNNTGAIFKDGDGYRAQIQIGIDPGSGRPVHRKVRAKTHADAVEALKELQRLHGKGLLAISSPGTLGDYLEVWLENVRLNRAPKTYEQYRWVCTYHILPTLGRKPLQKVSRQDVQALVRSLTGRQALPRSDRPPTASRSLGRRTMEVVRSVLRAAYNEARKDGLAAHNPAEHIDLPRVPKKQVAFLDPNHVGRLMLELAGSPIELLTKFLLVTGARISEARGLRWQDVDIPNHRVRIAGQLQRLGGRLTYRPTTKTHQDRHLPIPTWMTDELQTLRTRQMVEGAEDPDGIVFLNPEGRRMDDRWYSRQLAAACERAKVPVVSPHKLRHTAATLALMETGDLHAVQKMLGHQQVALTADLYGHATAESLRPMMEKLGRTIAPNG